MHANKLAVTRILIDFAIEKDWVKVTLAPTILHAYRLQAGLRSMGERLL